MCVDGLRAGVRPRPEQRKWTGDRPPSKTTITPAELEHSETRLLDERTMPEAAEHILKPGPAAELVGYPVSRVVNSPEVDDPQYVESGRGEHLRYARR